MGAETIFSTNDLEQLDLHMQKKKKRNPDIDTDTDFISFTKINSKWITDLNVKILRYEMPRT